jgi:hypothetical protein
VTYTTTSTQTFSLTSAKYVASKVAADLRYMRALYGKPSESEIERWIEELVLWIHSGYLGTVTYGFKRNGNCVLAVKYVADRAGNLTQDDTSGKVRPGVDVSGLPFYNYLTHSTTWAWLKSTQQAAFEATLPFQRTGAPEPGVEGGYWQEDRTYSADGGGVRRSTIRRFGE